MQAGIEASVVAPDGAPRTQRRLRCGYSMTFRKNPENAVMAALPDESAVPHLSRSWPIETADCGSGARHD